MYTLCVELFFSHIDFTIVIRVEMARSLCFLLFFECMIFLANNWRGSAGADSAGADQIHRRRERRSRGKFVGWFRRTYRRTVREEDEDDRDEDRARVLPRPVVRIEKEASH